MCIYILNEKKCFIEFLFSYLNGILEGSNDGEAISQILFFK